MVIILFKNVDKIKINGFIDQITRRLNIMSINLNIGTQDSYQYKTINKNSKQYQAAAKDRLGSIILAEMEMTPEQRMMYEMLGGREANMKAHMDWYDSEGNMLNGTGGIAGMSMDGVSLSKAHQIINVPEEWRQKMFDETKRHFIQENGVSNGNTTKRSEIFEGYQRSTSIDKRLNGTWTLNCYEQQYRKALYNAVKEADPDWQLGQSFDTSILNNITREDIDNSLQKISGTDGMNFVSKGIDVNI